MIKIHSVILMICSKFGILRATPWIPALVGVSILMLKALQKYAYNKLLPLILIVGFGLLTTSMCLEFLTEADQPIRKQIIFSIMSISSWTTLLWEIRKFKSIRT